MKIKPDLTMYFNQMPFIGQYMRYDYENAKSLNEMIILCHKWFTESEISKNPVRKIHFKAAANFLYTLITGKSYESKNIELLISELD